MKQDKLKKGYEEGSLGARMLHWPKEFHRGFRKDKKVSRVVLNCDKDTSNRKTLWIKLTIKKECVRAIPFALG